MSLYNSLFGATNQYSSFMKLLKYDDDFDWGRYRDIYIDDDDKGNKYIVIHTRNGGGNREVYEYVFDKVSNHPWYSHDEDCNFDCTYANIYFKVPNDKLPKLEKIEEHGPTTNPSEKWNILFHQRNISKNQ